MRNRITHYCKTEYHLILLFCLIFCFIVNTSIAKSQSINVYLKLKPNNTIETLIKEFSQYLTQQEQLTAYPISPFINQYPLHITMYLTDYRPQQIPVIMKEMQILAKQYQPIPFFTSEIIPSNNGYVMLSVAQNKKLQELSNTVVNILSNLRDKTAHIPVWAASDQGRKALFYQYGSPNVLQYFNPHFSIFDVEHLNKEQNARLYQIVLQSIEQFKRHHKIRVQASAYALGVGLANSQGQIEQELALFPMEL